MNTHDMSSSTILVDDLTALRQRRSMKWDSHPDDVRPLWVAEMDCLLAEPVRHALAGAVDRGDVGYAHRSGRTTTAYVEAFTGFARRLWGWAPDPKQVVLMPDVMQGAVHALGVLTQPGVPIVVTPPVYPPFFHHLAIDLGRRIVDVPLLRDPDGGYRLDLDGIDAAFAAGAGGMLLCNPHNPTGTVFTAAELAGLARIAAGRGARVVADEIHAPLVLGDRPFTPYLTVDPAAIAVHSGSKAFNLAGLKAALAVAGPDAAAELARVPDEVSVGAGLLGVLAGEAAYRDGDEWLGRLLLELRANQELLGSLLAEQLPEARWARPDATFLAWLDLRELDLGPDPAAAVLDRTRVALSPGPDFGAGGEGFARLNLATGPTLLAEAVTRLAGLVSAAPG
jgi:cysteine-S-conjugate beta-lyase